MDGSPILSKSLTLPSHSQIFVHYLRDKTRTKDRSDRSSRGFTWNCAHKTNFWQRTGTTVHIKTYLWVSPWWKTKRYRWGIYTNKSCYQCVSGLTGVKYWVRVFYTCCDVTQTWFKYVRGINDGFTEFVTDRVLYPPFILSESTTYTYLTLGSWKSDIGTSNVKRAVVRKKRKGKTLSFDFFPNYSPFFFLSRQTARHGTFP